MNKVLSLVAVVAILGVSFYAGQKSFGSSLEYEHADVLDIADQCKAGKQFIGACKTCKQCAKTEYSAGGCSYFKDTFCTLCTSIRNCKQTNTECTTKDDQHCTKCDDGYWVDPKKPKECTKCTLCSSTEYVGTACHSGPKGNSPKAVENDTKCVKCTQCWRGAQKGVRSFLKSVCAVGGNGVTVKNSEKTISAGKQLNSVCHPCRVCLNGFEYTQRTCESPSKLKLNKKEKKLAFTNVEAIQLYNGRKPKDTVCVRCTGCMSGEHALALKGMLPKGKKFATKVCKDTKARNGLYNDALKGGFSQCASCKQCGSKQFIKTPCDPGHPHKEWMCKSTKNAKGRATQCKTEYNTATRKPKVSKGQFLVNTIPAKMGSDTVCANCTPRKPGQWTVFPCNPKHTSDAVHQQCSKCVPGEYQFSKCASFSDTICPSCPNAREKLFKNKKEFKSGLQYCDIDKETGLPKTRCDSTTNAAGVTTPRGTKCGYWAGTGTKPYRYDSKMHDLPKDENRCLPFTRGGQHPKWSKCGQWKSGCKEGFFGQSCCYHKHPYSCGVITTRERSGRRMNYPKAGTVAERVDGKNVRADFAEFCMSLCSEFPDCLAVELEDGGTFAKPGGSVNELADTKACYFKSAFTQDQRFRWKGAYEDDRGVKREGDPKFDCYSNTCRQNVYTMAGTKPLKITNYKIPPKAKTNDELNMDKVKALCAKKCAPFAKCAASPEGKQNPAICASKDKACKTCTKSQLHKLTHQKTTVNIKKSKAVKKNLKL